jgi:hypothetical protein
VIVAGDARIEHIGTQFMAQRRGGEVEVFVRDGLVSVTLGSESRRLSRGQSGLLGDRQPGTIETRRVDAAGQAWDWADSLAPRLSIEGRDLLGVLRALAYQSGLELSFSDAGVEARAKGTTLHGPALDLPPRQAMRALLATSGLQIAPDRTGTADSVLIESR